MAGMLCFAALHSAALPRHEASRYRLGAPPRLGCAQGLLMWQQGLLFPGNLLRLLVARIDTGQTDCAELVSA